VLYTDGVVEARRDILAGLDALEYTAAEQYLRSPADLARVIVEQAVLGVERRDDALALVLRRQGETTTTTGDQFECRLRPQPIEVGRARREFSRWLDRAASDAAPADGAEELRLVVSELCTNAVAAARTSVVLRAWTDDGDTVIEVEDDGTAVVAPSSPDSCGDAFCESGRGLFIVDALVDELDVVSENERTVVRAVRSARNLVAPNSRSS